MQQNTVISRVLESIKNSNIPLSCQDIAKTLNENPVIISGSLRQLLSKGYIQKSDKLVTKRGGALYLLTPKKPIKIKLDLSIYEIQN